MENGTATESVHHIPLIMKIPNITKTGQIYMKFNINAVLGKYK